MSASHPCWLLEVYILATVKVISGTYRVPTCNRAHSWWLYSAITIVRYLTQSHYLDTKQMSHCPILLMPSAKLGGDKYLYWFASTGNRTPDLEVILWITCNLQLCRNELHTFTKRDLYTLSANFRTDISCINIWICSINISEDFILDSFSCKCMLYI